MRAISSQRSLLARRARRRLVREAAVAEARGAGAAACERMAGSREDAPPEPGSPP